MIPKSDESALQVSYVAPPPQEPGERNLVAEYVQVAISAQSEQCHWLGTTRSHTSAFRRFRDTRIDEFAVETNQLIIRLDKLVTQAPADPKKRKGPGPVDLFANGSVPTKEFVAFSV